MNTTGNIGTNATLRRVRANIGAVGKQ